MRIIAEKHLKMFLKKYNDASRSLLTRKLYIKKFEYKWPNDIKRVFPHASILWNNRVVFNIKWNSYRLIVSISYVYQAVYIKFLWTHAEYDTVDATTINKF